jgi:hypothetical protein
MKRLIALGTLSFVVALSLVIVPLASAQVVDNGTSLGQQDGSANVTSSTTTSGDAMTNDATGTTSPGLPNTGVGGNAAVNTAVLLASGLVVLGGVALLSRRTA